MEKLKNSSTEKLILVEAYKLFLQKSLEGVTIGEIELASQKARGTIFYYFDSKLDIFKRTVDAFFFPYLTKIPCTKEISLKSYFLEYTNPYAKIISFIKELESEIDPNIAFVNFVMQAIRVYPNFAYKHNQLLLDNYKNLDPIIKLAQDNGEIKNIQCVTEIIYFVTLGKIFAGDTLNPYSTTDLYHSLYSMVKE
ncbi:MAG TPA: hypothetical protein DCY66_00265, partial [Bacteroides sp.]|nr:hypothetical protein [Bacteroides sp.]